MSILRKFFNIFDSDPSSLHDEKIFSCPKCGYKVSQNDNFCSKCGFKLGNLEQDEEKVFNEKNISVIEDIPDVQIDSSVNNDIDKSNVDNKNIGNPIIDVFDENETDKSKTSLSYDDNSIIDIFEEYNNEKTKYEEIDIVELNYIKQNNESIKKEDGFDLLKEIYAFIFKVFDDVNSDVISAKCLFARMKIFKPQLLELIDVNNFGDLYDVLYDKLYKYDSLYFKKPYIGKNEFSDLNEVVLKHFSTIEVISFDEYKDYQGQTGINPSISYYSFIEKNQNLLLINEKEAVRFDDFTLEKNDIEKMGKILKLYFDNRSVLKTINLNLIMFPNINNYNLNKFLIISIIRKYFCNDYEIKVENISIGNIDYIVRRKDNETN